MIHPFSPRPLTSPWPQEEWRIRLVSRDLLSRLIRLVHLVQSPLLSLLLHYWNASRIIRGLLSVLLAFQEE